MTRSLTKLTVDLESIIRELRAWQVELDTFRDLPARIELDKADLYVVTQALRHVKAAAALERREFTEVKADRALRRALAARDVEVDPDLRQAGAVTFNPHRKSP